MKLKDKTVVITGASSGIGRAVALRCAQDEAKVVLASRTKEKLDKVAEEVREKGGTPLVVPTDVTDPEQVKNLFDQTMKEFGCVDVVFNNAGLGFIKDLQDMTDDEIKLTVNVNLLGEIYVAKYAAIIFVKQKSGHLINTSSLAGLITVPQWAVYCATKWGVTGFTDTIRLELGKHGVKVTSLHPGAVNTDFFAPNKADLDISKTEETIEPEEVAETVYNAIFTDKERILVPSMAKNYSLLYRFMPGLTQKMIEKLAKDVERPDGKTPEYPFSYVTPCMKPLPD